MTVPAGGLKSACTSETVVVKNNPTIATVIKTGTAPNDTAITNPVTIPITVHDTATLTGATADAGGTVTYRLFTNNTCTTPSTSPQLGAVAADGVTVTVTGGIVPNSPNVTFSTPVTPATPRSSSRLAGASTARYGAGPGGSGPGGNAHAMTDRRMQKRLRAGQSPSPQ